MSRRMTGNNNLHLLRENKLTCDPSPGGGAGAGGETPYDALEDIEPFFF